MRYSEIDLQIEDIMWFAIDNSNHVLAFTSGGCGNVPEFVCCSKEDTELLETFFMEELKKSTQCLLLIDSDGTPLTEDSMKLAEKGIYCYDVSFDEGHEEEYVQIAVPNVPLQSDQLPDDILRILKNHRISANAKTDKYLHVEHAY